MRIQRSSDEKLGGRRAVTSVQTPAFSVGADTAGERAEALAAAEKVSTNRSAMGRGRRRERSA